MTTEVLAAPALQVPTRPDVASEDYRAPLGWTAADGTQRVAVVRNLDPWYAAYKVTPGQKLYLAPEQRVRIW